MFQTIMDSFLTTYGYYEINRVKLLDDASDFTYVDIQVLSVNEAYAKKLHEWSRDKGEKEFFSSGLNIGGYC